MVILIAALKISPIFEERLFNKLFLVDDSDTQWVDLLGSGRLYKKITNKGTGEKAERGKLARLQIRVPKEPTSLSFGTEACELNDHNIVEVLLGDGLDCPPAVELATYELNVGGEVAIRSHPDLRANLPEAFAIKLLGIIYTVYQKRPKNANIKFEIWFDF